MRGTATTGAAGAYFVAAELSQRGWVASTTWRNAPRTDVLAQNFDAPVLAAIQVKTRTRGDFQLGLGAETPAEGGSNEWYALVALQGFGVRPDYYIVPRDHVSALTYVGYRAWLAAPGRGGRQRRPHDKRDFSPADFAAYREAWDLLDLPAVNAPWRLEAWVWDAAAEHGLPDGHPGLGPRP